MAIIGKKSKQQIATRLLFRFLIVLFVSLLLSAPVPSYASLFSSSSLTSQSNPLALGGSPKPAYHANCGNSVASDCFGKDLTSTKYHANCGNSVALESNGVNDGLLQPPVKSSGPKGSSSFFGYEPTEILHDPFNGLIYVSNYANDSVSVINATSNRIILDIATQSAPQGLAYDSKNYYVYVNAASAIYAINSTTNRIADTISFNSSFYNFGEAGIKYDSINNTLFAADESNATLVVINPLTNKVIKTIQLESEPEYLAFDSANNDLYVTRNRNAFDTGVTVVSGSNDSIVATIQIPNPGPAGIAYDPARGNVYVANDASQSLSVINTTTNQISSSISLSIMPQEIAYDKNNGYLYVTNDASSPYNISVVDPNAQAQIATIGLADYSLGITFDQITGDVYVTIPFYMNAIAVVNPTQDTVLTYIGHPVPLTFSYAYAQNGTGGTRAPTLTFTYNGTRSTVSLAENLTTYVVDYYSTWNVSESFQGISQGERFEGDQNALYSGLATSSFSQNYTYFLEFETTFVYHQVTPGRQGGYTPYFYFENGGESNTTSSNDTQVWADAQSPWELGTGQYHSLTERWQANSTSGTIQRAGVILFDYYYQFKISSYLLVFDGSTPGSPITLSGTSTGTQSSGAIAYGKWNQFWYDSGTNWSVTTVAYGAVPSSERWILFQNQSSGSVVSGQNITFAYVHQFYLSVSEVGEGGEISNSTGWYGSGSYVALSVTATQPGWMFEGWQGSGGDFGANKTSITIYMTHAVIETALFYIGVSLSSGSGGSIVLSSGSKQVALVDSGESNVVYLPPGSNITISAVPSSPFYSFEGWSGTVFGGSQIEQFVLLSPLSLRSSFVYDTQNIELAIGIVSAAATIVASSLFLGRKLKLDDL